MHASSGIRPDPSLSLLKSPNEFIPALETALSDSVRLRHNPEKHDIEGREYRVGFRGSFGDHHLNPRTLRASHLGNMISVEGIVTRCMSITIYRFSKADHKVGSLRFLSEAEDAQIRSLLPKHHYLPRARVP